MGWQDAPVVAQPAGKAAWESAPVVGGPQLTGKDQIPDSKPMAQGPAEPSFMSRLGAGAKEVGRTAANMLTPSGMARGMAGLGETGLAMVTGAAAPAAGVIRQAQSGQLGDPNATYRASQTSGYQPQTPQGQATTRAIGEIGSKIPGADMLGAIPGMAGEMSALGRSVPAVARAAGDAAGAVPRPSMPSIPSKPGGVIDTLRGTTAEATRKAATEESRRALGEAGAEFGKQANAAGQAKASALSEANSYADLQTRLQRDLDASAAQGVPSVAKQGERAREVVTGAFEVAKKARAEGTKDLYKAAEDAAATRERDGARIDITGVTDKLDAMMENAKNIPELQTKLGKLAASVKGKATPNAPGIVDLHGKPFKTTPTGGLTYKELDLANRYLKDIAYEGELQGYDGLVRKEALALSHELDKAITKFVPEHRVASQTYANLSKPLESVSTRIGKALTGTEGGLKGEAYNKVAAQNLPARLFGTKEGVNLVVDALAGGTEATPAARLAAQKQVDQMVEHWVVSGARGTGETPAVGKKALDYIGGKAGTLEAVPEVGKRVRGQFEREAAKEQTMGELAAGSKEARGRAAEAGRTAESAQASRAKVEGLLKDMEGLSATGSPKLQRQAQDAALSSLRSMVKSGDLPEDRFKAALALIARSETEAERTTNAVRIAKMVAKYAGYTVAGTVGATAVKGALK